MDYLSSQMVSAFQDHHGRYAFLPVLCVSVPLRETQQLTDTKKPAGDTGGRKLVDPSGFEPLTSSMPLRRSSN